MSDARDRLTSVAAAAAVIDAACVMISGAASALALWLPHGHPAVVAAGQLAEAARVTARKVGAALARVPNPRE